MVEHRPWNDIIGLRLRRSAYSCRLSGDLALIASTHDAATVVGRQHAACAGGHALEKLLRAVLCRRGALQREPVGRLLFNSLVSATGIAAGKIFISILSAYAVVVFPLSVPERPRSGSSSSR